MRRCLWLLFPILACLHTQAQDPAYTLLTEEDGLISNEVYHVIQDSLGYIWFGTDNGVCRYDGKTFKTFRSPRQKSQAMHNLYLGQEGRIWMSNFSDQVFYIENDSLYEWQPLVKAGIGTDHFTYRYPYIYTGSQSKLYVYDLTEGSWSNLSEQYFPKGGSQSNTFNARGPLVFGNRNSLWRFEGKKGYPIDLSQISKYPNPRYTGDIGLEVPAYGARILFSKIANPEAVPLTNHYFLTDEDRFVPLNIPGWPSSSDVTYQINRIQQVGSHNWWLLTHEGCAKFDPYEASQPPLSFHFKNFRISSVLKDREGNHWFSTLGKGVIFVPSMDNILYTPTQSGFYTLSDLRVRCFGKDGKDRLWIGHQNGMVNIWSSHQSHSLKLYRNNREVNGFHWDETAQRMYVARFRLFEMEGLNPINQFTGSSTKDCFPFKNVVFVAYPDRISAFRRYGRAPLLGWTVDQPHIFPTIPRSNKHRSRISIYRGERSLHMGLYRGWSIYVDTLTASGFRIWQGYADTLRYTNSNGWSGSCQDPQTGEPIHARDIEQGADSVLWIGTANQGVYGIRDSQVVYHFSTAQGFPDNKTPCIYLEEDTVWVGCKEGLIRLVPKDSSIAVFDQTDGLVSSEVRDVIEWKGDIWLATYKGLQRIKRSALKPNVVPPRIRIIRTAIMEKDSLFPSGTSFPFSLNNLRFDFEGISFRSKGRFYYKYRMIGLDSSWVSLPSTQESIRFPSLPPGEFRFEIIAVNEDGIPSKQPASLAFSILKPWYQSWWFYALVVLSITGIVSLGFALKTRQERTRRRFEKQLDHLKMSALQAQMNPHFIFNALNAIQYYFTENQAENALTYLSKFSKLIRTIFEHAKLPRITLEEEVVFLELYCQLEQLRFSDKVSVEWNIDPDLDTGIEIPPLLMQPILENSFKYGLLHKKEKGTLSVVMRQGQQQVYICIEDDGVGREAALRLRKPRLNRQRSAGIQTIEERLKIYHKEIRRPKDNPLVITDLYSPEGKACGTRVELFLAFP